MTHKSASSSKWLEARWAHGGLRTLREYDCLLNRKTLESVDADSPKVEAIFWRIAVESLGESYQGRLVLLPGRGVHSGGDNTSSRQVPQGIGHVAASSGQDVESR